MIIGKLQGAQLMARLLMLGQIVQSLRGLLPQMRHLRLM